MTDPETLVLRVSQLAKSFVLHNQGGVILPVFRDLDLDVAAGECVVLDGASGVGKSTLLRAIHGNYKTAAGQILLRHRGSMVDVAAAEPRRILELRRWTLGYVSQFLRVIPRIAAIDIVAEPMQLRGLDAATSLRRAADLLARLNLPERLWRLPPATFSGGEQQRINLARGFAVEYPMMLLDEPTAALDGANRAAVVDLIEETRARGAAILGIFHDRETREKVATRLFTMEGRLAA
ncbi:MAG TPA: phosphonate C-P lyase system protein PhnL [Stellaceae bacterium]|nr:phosphonate C-P lyase system protein PhnL [Stellaceae bacterium]